MANKKTIKSKQQSTAALELEKAGDIPGAIKLYQKAAATDPMNEQAWNRQMILFRKTRTRPQEITLVKSAIAAFKQQSQAEQQEWLSENREKAESTRELAKVLGLLEDNGLPLGDHTAMEKWETRLYLLEYREKNARKKKTYPKKPKKAAQIKTLNGKPIKAVKERKAVPGKQIKKKPGAKLSK